MDTLKRNCKNTHPSNIGHVTKNCIEYPPFNHWTRYKKIPTPPPPLLRFSNASIARRSLLIRKSAHKLIEKPELAFIHIHATKTVFLFIFCISNYNQDKTIRLWKYLRQENGVWILCFVVLLHIFFFYKFRRSGYVGSVLPSQVPQPTCFWKQVGWGTWLPVWALTW